METWQKLMFNNIHKWMTKGIDEDWEYLGFHLIQFENSGFEDGRCWYDGREILECDLVSKLTI